MFYNFSGKNLVTIYSKRCTCEVGYYDFERYAPVILTGILCQNNCFSIERYCIYRNYETTY